VKIKVAKITTILEYLILLCFIFGSTMATWRYQVGRTISSAFLTYILYAIAIIYILLGVLSNKYAMTRKQALLLFGFFCYSVTYSFLGRDLSTTYWIWYFLPLFLMLLFCFELRKRGRTEMFFLEFSNIVVILALVSVVLYFGGEVFHTIPSQNIAVTRTEMSTYSIPSYYGLLYIGQSQTMFGMTFARNTGIFLEGPSWGSFLWPAFFVELFVRNKIKKMNCLFIVLAVVTSFSLKGIIFCLVIIGIKYIKGSIVDKRKTAQKDLQFNYKILLFPIFLFIVGVVAFNLLMSKSTFEAGSIIARADDILATFNAWMKKPVFGCGFYNESFIRSYMSGNIARGNTAGLLKVFALGGLVSGLEYIYGIVLFIKNGAEKRFERTTFGVLLIINLCISSTFNSLFALFFVALGLTYLVNVREPNKDYE